MKGACEGGRTVQVMFTVAKDKEPREGGVFSYAMRFWVSSKVYYHNRAVLSRHGRRNGISDVR